MLKRILPALIALAALAGCAGMQPLDTMNKRMLAFEVAYDEVLTTIERQRAEGRIAPTTQARIAQGLRDINRARAFAYAALEAGDPGVFDDKMRLMQSVLQMLRELAAQAEPTKGASDVRQLSGSD